MRRQPRFRHRMLMISVACLAVSLATYGGVFRAHDRFSLDYGASRAVRLTWAIGYHLPVAVLTAMGIGAVGATVFMIRRRVATLRANLRRRPLERPR